MPEVTLQQAFDLAIQHHQAGRLNDAESLYRQILAVEPRHADALHLLGVIAHQAGRSELAMDLISKAIEQNPACASYHSNLGAACRVAGETERAIAAYRRAIQLRPDFAEAHGNLGLVLAHQDQLAEAIAAYRRAIQLKPDFADACNNLGVALRRTGQTAEAIAAFRSAIRYKPDFADAHNNLGHALQEQGELELAIAAYRSALQTKPDCFEIHNDLGHVLQKRGQLDQAIAAYQAAIRCKPESAETYSNLGCALWQGGQLDQAISACRRAIELNPDLAEAYDNLGSALMEHGQIDEAVAACRSAIQLKPGLAVAHSNLLLNLSYHPGYDAAAILKEARRWNQVHAEPLKPAIRAHPNDRRPGRRLKIGYVSQDFRNHAVGRFLLPLLAAHDHESYEIFAYSAVETPDAVTAQLRHHTDHWRSIVGVTDEQVAEAIRQDEIDILVDLSLHTGRNRLLIFARKPAPVQVTYLAYAGTSGLSTMDYRLTDPFMDPAGLNDANYAEQSLRLPKTYWCYAPTCPEIPVGPLPALAGGGVTFGSLNNFIKINASVLELWIKILREVPGSRLVLHAHEGSHRQRILDLMARAGIAPEHLSFAGRRPIADYYRGYHSIDIALDPFPFAGGTTSCDALWMGVPLVSLCGQSAVARAGLSLLSNLGMPELVAHTAEDYVRIAVELAGDLPRLAELRSTLRERMEKSPLMDAPGFARDIEAAYRQMWRTWCEQPDSTPCPK